MNCEIYTGKNIEETDDGPKTNRLVKRLIKSYLNKGYYLCMDHSYNNIHLSKELLELKTRTTGTIHSNR